ncbi:MAG: LysR family transcriptional regulator [Gammaproteobacteria bacterium]|nr:LysR family transcriptional regulator [Gammaproteobacteria bacterium]
MRYANLRSMNLNLLPILQSLLSTRNVTRSAEQLHMSQPAVSDALAKLRVHYDDDLLVRAGRGMKPTQFALSLQTVLDDSIEAMERLIQRESFDLHDLQRRFIISTVDSVVLTLVNKLISDLRTEAPGVTVQFIDPHSEDLQALRATEIDLLILPRGVLDTSGMHEIELYQETFVCIARADHPKVNGILSKRAYNAMTHAAFRPDHRMDLSFETTLVGQNQNDVVRLPNFTLLPAIVEQSDAVALIQKRTAEHFAARYDIKLFQPPFPIPSVAIAGYWSQIHNRDSAHEWFRNRVRLAAL